MSTDFALDMAWKSAVLAAAVLIMLTLMRRHNPSYRAAVGGLGLAFLLLLPVIALSIVMLPVPSLDVPAPATGMPVVPLATDQGTILFSLAGPDPSYSSTPPISAEALIATLWAAGALFIIFRLVAGLVTLRRWTEGAERLSSPAWTKLMRRYGVPQSTRLFVSDQISAPLSWGWRMPVILINRETLAQPGQAEAVIAHEAAHLNRFDWPRLLAARVAVAIFWFNPLVWLLERRHLQDVEEAADVEATRRVEPTHYAQALLNVARDCSAPVGANSMASGALSKRISQVLNRRAPSRWERAWRTGAFAGTALIAGSVAVTQFVAPAVSAAVVATPTIGPPWSPPVAPSVPAASAAAPAVSTNAHVVRSPKTAAIPMAAMAPATAVQAPPASLRATIINQEALEDVLEAAAEARAQAGHAVSDAKRVASEVAASMAEMRDDLLRGAEEMERGAVEMRQGAAEMREEARKLRNPSYRAEQIRRAAALGHHVPTDQELINAIPKMEKGARKMDEGVEKMREGAERMRRKARRS